MPGPFTPADTLIGPIAQALKTEIQMQIPSIAYVYLSIPDRPVMDNSVMLPMTRARVLDDTNGKLKVDLTFSATHVFRRSESADNIARAYTYVMPWLNMLNAWPNQSLGGLAIEVNTSDVKVTKLIESGQVVMALVTTIDVVTEVNIVLS